MSQQPLVSVLIDNYNYGRFLRHCIDSVLQQTYPHVEVVVVDDGSTDNSRDVLNSLGDKVVAVLQKNGGQASALNAGFAVCNGTWICLLDSDDLFELDKVRQIVALAAEYPTAGLIAHDQKYCNEAGEPIQFSSPCIAKRTLADDREMSRRGSLSAWLPAHSGLSFRRDVFASLSPLPEDIRMGIDNYMKWVTQSRYPVLLTPELLTTQRIHGTNAGTILQETGGAQGLLRLARQSARTTFHVNKDYPHLKKLTWKQYGRLLYTLRSSDSDEAQEIERDIRRQYSVVENNPYCYLYVAAAFAKAAAERLVSK